MSKQKSSQPTDAELAILQILWERGPSTVREINDLLNEERPTGYTTTLKLMQIMLEKQLLARDESQRTHIYRALLSRQNSQEQTLNRIRDRFFGGSATRLVLQALGGSAPTAEELREIRALLDSIEGRQQ